MKKAYIDTNVLVGRFLPVRNMKSNPKLHRAKEVLNQFNTGTYMGVISTFTLLEFANICQQVEAYNTEQLGSMGDDERRDHTLLEGRAKYKDVLSHILSLSYVKFTNGKNVDFSRVTSDALSIMNETAGTVIQYGKNLKLKRANAADLLHVMLAKYEKCDEFLTFDRYIERIQSHELVEPLKITTYAA